jgi:hypothetical protein
MEFQGTRLKVTRFPVKHNKKAHFTQFYMKNTSFTQFYTDIMAKIMRHSYGSITVFGIPTPRA